MPHHTPLISTIVVCLVLAFILGAVMHRLRASPLIGYLLAGVIIGPFTPGYIADQDIANQLAELGVILLMFGVGLHFSLEDLLSVRAVAIPGAIAQIAVATALGMALAWALGWSTGAGRSPATRPIPRSSRRSICRRALLARRHSRCVRGWAGGGSGAQDQPRAPHPGARALGGRGRSSQEARRDRGRDGQARDREGDARRHRCQDVVSESVSAPLRRAGGRRRVPPARAPGRPRRTAPWMRTRPRCG